MPHDPSPSVEIYDAGCETRLRPQRPVHAPRQEFLGVQSLPGQPEGCRQSTAYMTELRPEHLAPEVRPSLRKTAPQAATRNSGLNLEEVEIKLLREAVERSADNQSNAASLLGLSRTPSATE